MLGVVVGVNLLPIKSKPQISKVRKAKKVCEIISLDIMDIILSIGSHNKQL